MQFSYEKTMQLSLLQRFVCFRSDPCGTKIETFTRGFEAFKRNFEACQLFLNHIYENNKSCN